MRKVISVGGIVAENRQLLLIKFDSGLYVIPKGHKQPGENDKQTAVREVEEETGVLPEIILYVGALTRQAIEDSGEVVEKTIKVYKMGKKGTSKKEPDETSEWVDVDTAIGSMHFQEESEFIATHLSSLVQDV